MTDHSAPETGATDDGRTDSTTTQTETGEDRGPESGASVEELAAENRALRQRIEDLESALDEIRAGITDESTNGGGDDTAAATEADGEPVLVTGGGQDCKVIGEFTAESGIGVFGHNQATTGTATGVKGVTDSSEFGATGVRGEATASGEVYGVHGNSSSIEANGVVGSASGGPVESANLPIGVYGYTDRSSDDGIDEAFGVAGLGALPDNTSGIVHGVAGATQSTSAESYGVLSLTNAGVRGDLHTLGDVYTNSDGDRVSRLYFGDKSNPPGQLSHDNVEDSFTLTTNTKSGDTFEVKMDVELNQDTTLQRTAGPLAKGYVSSDMNTINGVNINSVSYDSTSDRYLIDITNLNYSATQHAAVVTPRIDAVAFETGTLNDNLTLEFADSAQHDFNFVVYDLPSGTETTSTNESTADETDSGGE